ncbi:DUF3025 domain-containing protein [Salinimonas marina]|uniref:DUF3025 domain-containing protein n=1 Tax=Salinimonas marina TaxID=2785918 RepID=A0A7S9HCF3_9ALTE|nr:DUF3025 domain-containing protein [Salinimonas marina]QPG04822.1 DUF3025 domain-containing protein [Salinimonas marina]
MKSNEPNWQAGLSLASFAQPVKQVLSELGLAQLSTFPRAVQLNYIVDQRFREAWQGPEFVDQGQLNVSETRYYEEIIAEDNCIPTREDSWHDLFNACIWLQFPLTKQYLNMLHVQDIRDHGVHPRTKRRNHVTHFDECGVILAVPHQYLQQANELLQQLASHEWLEALYFRRECWQQQIFAFVFGHANLEMMLSPFMGLTGKWLAVEVDDNFAHLSAFEQTQHLDQALLRRIRQLDDFNPPRLMPPLPLLGVPGWWTGQTEQFYRNTDYFRPLPAGKGTTPQLPLT